jgi:hypothetical protein
MNGNSQSLDAVMYACSAMDVGYGAKDPWVLAPRFTTAIVQQQQQHYYFRYIIESPLPPDRINIAMQRCLLSSLVDDTFYCGSRFTTLICLFHC